jgi:hypothetical protein
MAQKRGSREKCLGEKYLMWYRKSDFEPLPSDLEKRRPRNCTQLDNTQNRL